MYPTLRPVTAVVPEIKGSTGTTPKGTHFPKGGDEWKGTNGTMFSSPHQVRWCSLHTPMCTVELREGLNLYKSTVPLQALPGVVLLGPTWVYGTQPGCEYLQFVTPRVKRK